MSDDGRPIRVLDVTKFYAASGGGVKTYLSAKRSWAAGRTEIEHAVVIPGPRDARETDGATRVYRIRGPRIPFSPAYRFLLSVRKLRAVIEAERPDIIEVGSPFLVPWVVLRAARDRPVSRIGFYHCDIVGAYTGRLMPSRPRALHRRAVAWTKSYVAAVYNRFAATVAATPSTVELLRDCGVERVERVPLGVDAGLFHPGRRDPAWRDELDLPGGTPLLVYAGRWCREKEVDVVLEAVPDLHRRYGAVTLFVGEGHLRPAIERLAGARPEAVRVLGYQTDPEALARILAGADIYLAPFSYETFGLSALEAMACGRPVVGSRSLGLSDLLADERCGRGFRPGDARDLVRAVGAVLEAGPDELGSAARAVASGFTWDRTFERLYGLYERLARPGRAGRPIRSAASVPGG